MEWIEILPIALAVASPRSQSKPMLTIVYVQKDPDGANELAKSLGLDYRVVHCPECQTALAGARRRDSHALILDLEVGAEEPFTLLEELRRIADAPPVLALSRSDDPRPVVRALRSGATDVLRKPPRAAEIRSALIRCLGEPERDIPYPIGNFAAARELGRQIKAFAEHDFPILITGESGTGKELATRAIHNFSARKHGPQIARNCAALPTELIESELFGSTEGAFTGAADRPGAFELAHGGTLFLDEIGDASAETQVKLLRALESGSVWRLGAKEPREVDVRFISATSRDLKEAMAQGSFRPDLFYRIETLQLRIPPLRERIEDIPILTRAFLREAGKGCKDIGEDALDKLVGYRWPGNIRQLRNAIQRAVVLSGGRELIRAEDIVVQD